MKSPFSKIAFFTKQSQKVRRIKARTNQARCNICDRMFRAATHFHRFCKNCKSDDELFKFHEWLPQT